MFYNLWQLIYEELHPILEYNQNKPYLENFTMKGNSLTKWIYLTNLKHVLNTFECNFNGPLTI